MTPATTADEEHRRVDPGLVRAAADDEHDEHDELEQPARRARCRRTARDRVVPWQRLAIRMLSGGDAEEDARPAHARRARSTSPVDAGDEAADDRADDGEDARGSPP